MRVDECPKSSMTLCKSLAALSSLALFFVLLFACESNAVNGGTTTTSATPAATPTPVATPAATALLVNAPGAVEMLHGFVVPPDPGAAATATVAGVDTNQNGIRDEIDRHIAQAYGEKAVEFVAAQALARAAQLLLITPAADVDAAIAGVYASANLGVCLTDRLQDDPTAAARINSDITQRTFNTSARQQHLQAISSKVGPFARSIGEVTCL